MKRTNADRGNADRGGGGLGKRQRNSDGYAEALAEGKFELRFLLPTKCAGAVIGRGGEKIKAIREKVCFLDLAFVFSFSYRLPSPTIFHIGYFSDLLFY
jgi:hypothetical protein